MDKIAFLFYKTTSTEADVKKSPPAFKKLLKVFLKQRPTTTGGQCLQVLLAFSFITLRSAKVIINFININHQSKNEQVSSNFGENCHKRKVAEKQKGVY